MLTLFSQVLINKPLPWQQVVEQEEIQGQAPRQDQPAADRLSQALKDFGLGVVTMQEHGTPVPYGHFYVTRMCQAAGEAGQLQLNFESPNKYETDLPHDWLFTFSFLLMTGISRNKVPCRHAMTAMFLYFHSCSA